MHGVIAAGSVPTAEAGAEILRRGGNAADAAVAACFATSAGEPTLTSLAGAGVLIHRDAASGAVTVCDFFSDAPRLGPDDVDDCDFFGVHLDFGPTTQEFHIGAGAAAVPGVIPGLCEALERFGTLPLSAVIEPACRMLRTGVVLGPYQGRAARLLEPILTHSEAARAVFAPSGTILAAGDRFVLPQLADTLEALAGDWRAHYDDVIATAMLAQFGPGAGGLLSAEDLESYQVRFDVPLELRYRQSSVLTVPPPAAGGSMIALMLRLLESVDLGRMQRLSPDHVRALAAAMTTADEARGDGPAALERAQLTRWQQRFDALRRAPSLAAVPAAAGREHTTHISVLDAQGNATSVTFSYGEGNGLIVGDTGIMMNNLMGEEDLHPLGFGKSPRAARLSTMMSPTLLLDDDGGIIVMGTGGANRIRSAIVQAIGLLEDFGLDPAGAVAAPRMHYEDGVLHVEVFDMEDGGDALAALGAPKYVRFPERNLFFGGVHLVERDADGTLRGGGDPRRGGVCIVV